MRFSFLPREEQYFDLVEQATNYLVEGAAKLDDLARHFENVEEKIRTLKADVRYELVLEDSKRFLFRRKPVNV